MTKRQIIAPIFFGIIAIFCISMGVSNLKHINEYKYTPTEWVKSYHTYDSLKITEKETDFAITYLDKILEPKVKEHKIISDSYDDSIKAYKITYKFLPKKSTSTSYIYKTIWIRMNFNTNGGDYIVKPQIVKLIAYKRDS